jgi:hypothetical protein
MGKIEEAYTEIGCACQWSSRLDWPMTDPDGKVPDEMWQKRRARATRWVRREQTAIIAFGHAVLDEAVFIEAETVGYSLPRQFYAVKVRLDALSAPAEGGKESE